MLNLWLLSGKIQDGDCFEKYFLRFRLFPETSPRPSPFGEGRGEVSGEGRGEVFRY